ncbi:UNVERIFIED_CONTAM: hypothetical protein Sradi_3873300 [Sesamum radiatum]|uniref:Retrotransposon gag domain-containing protein n=1 Tax=Sesamum radiatum TaxID=300843 RepID=A0AAW2Q2A5_SESRA
MADEFQVNCRILTIVEYDGTTDPVEHLSQFENAALLHRYSDGIKCCVFITTFARAAQQWFNQLPVGAIGSFQEFRSLFLHQFTTSRKLRKTKLSLFVVREKDNEPLKEYLQRFNAATLKVPSATQKVQGLLDGDFFKSLAKKSVSKCNALLAHVANYINMEYVQATKKRESRGKEKRDERGDPFQETPYRYAGQEVSLPKSEHCVHPFDCTYNTSPHRFRRKEPIGSPQECRHIKNEIERLIQNGYLQEYVCWEKARGTGPYQKQEWDKAKEMKASSPEHFPKEGAKYASKSKGEVNDPPHKGVIRMIAGAPIGRDSLKHENCKSERRTIYP